MRNELRELIIASPLTADHKILWLEFINLAEEVDIAEILNAIKEDKSALLDLTEVLATQFV